MRAMKIVVNRRQIESVLLIFVMVAMSVVVLFPISTPKAEGLDHLGSTTAEDWDGAPGPHPYDVNPAVGIVEWPPLTGGEDHMLTSYTVTQGTTLIIPALDYIFDDFSQSVIKFVPSGGPKIDVHGTLITNAGGQFTKTAFWSETGSWDGIYFHPGSSGCLNSCLIRGAYQGVVFQPDSSVISPGITNTNFDQMGAHGLQLLGAGGYTNVNKCDFDDTMYEMSYSIEVSNGMANITDCTFTSHEEDIPQLHVSNADVFAEWCSFVGLDRPGSEVLIEGDSDGTVLKDCYFQAGGPDEHMVSVEGCSPLIVNCTFDLGSGALSVKASEDTFGNPAHPEVLNPRAMVGDFDNSTLNATDTSIISLQWYLHVEVKDPNDNPIFNAPVWVKDRLGNPSSPPSKSTDMFGLAKWFVVTELDLYESSVDHYNSFNVSAENQSMKGYAIPEPGITESTTVTVYVPFNPIPNILPNVSWLPTPPGIQSGYVTIEYRLNDPDPGDDGNLSVEVYYSFDKNNWYSATPGPGSHPTSPLFNDTLYYFIWDSVADVGFISIPQVYFKIVPKDKSLQEGTYGITDSFALDNRKPILREGPTATTTDTTALIQWEVDEAANATVWYGLGTTLTTEESNNSASMIQSILLTNLLPGRQYTYIINSTDLRGNKYSSDPTTFTFDTKILIQVYEGWNMISLPPYLDDWLVNDVLESIDEQWDIVMTYFANDPLDPWKSYNINKPPDMNDLNVITHYMGLWLHMNSDAVLIPDHTDPTTDPEFPGSTDIHLFVGWNLVPYPSITTQTITDALDGISYNLVQTLDAATGDWLENDGLGGETDTLNDMELGRSYWIHTDTEQDWSVSYL